MILDGASIVLGVTGGIAAYKAVDLCSKLVQAGAVVDVIMTEAATQFVTPLPFQTISKRPVSIDPFALLRDTDMAHIALSERADIIVVAPATANTIAKLAHGIADNLLTSTILATTADVLLAPAMNADMWANAATRQNVGMLRERGVRLVGPGYGRLASGRVGAGRLVDTPEILAAIRKTLGRSGPLAGVRIVVTAGGTQEPLDPVRHLGNRSSGRMGYALAEAARDMGAQVKLISAPTGLDPVLGVEMLGVRSAQQMHDAVLSGLPETDVLIMAAAVADYTPAQVAANKIKKTDGGLSLELRRTPDILAAVAQNRRHDRSQTIVGFAAETEHLLVNAADKLSRKCLDMIVANDVSGSDSGFQSAQNRVTILVPGAEPKELPLLDKFDVAERVLTRIAALRSQQ